MSNRFDVLALVRRPAAWLILGVVLACVAIMLAVVHPTHDADGQVTGSWYLAAWIWGTGLLCQVIGAVQLAVGPTIRSQRLAIAASVVLTLFSFGVELVVDMDGVHLLAALLFMYVVLLEWTRSAAGEHGGSGKPWIRSALAASVLGAITGVLVGLAAAGDFFESEGAYLIFIFVMPILWALVAFPVGFATAARSRHWRAAPAFGASTGLAAAAVVSFGWLLATAGS